MADLYLSDFEVLSSQGDLGETIKAIQTCDINIDTLHICTDVQNIDVPYFLLKKKIDENVDEIYQALKTLMTKIVTQLKAKDGRDSLKNTSIIIGTTLADLYVVSSIQSSLYMVEKPPFESTKTSIDSYAKRLANEFGLFDLTLTINTACTSSANAILEGANLINAGIVERVIVLGIEIHLPLMSSGFSSMGLLTESLQKPFEDERDGLVLGEGLAGVVVSKVPSKHKLKGGYSNCHAETITGVSMNGDEYINVMKRALDRAGVAEGELSAIKTHATSTKGSDESEMNALKMFKELPLLSALKPYIGHTIGACGVLELTIFLACIDVGFIPKLPSHKVHEKCCEGVFMLNFFGFGGNNVSLLVSSGEHETVY